jgi:hypothetical protein
MSDYPEHEKLHEVVDKSQALGEFLDVWLPSQGLTICEIDDEISETRFFPTHRTIKSMLADFFDIDQKKIDEEKEQMLRDIRSANA